MADMMKVLLSTQAAAAHWGEGALLSFNDDQVLIHLDLARQEPDALRAIQRAGRRLESTGIKRVKLAGDAWDLERRYAFAQGFYAAKGVRELDLGEQSVADARELDALIKASRWVREVTNGCPEDIYPMSLAESALLLIRGLAGDQVTARITAGEALREAGHIGIWSVGRGSEREPVLLELDYNPTGDRNAPVVAALVGKGITFDSGGYSMKSSDNMLPMKSDMGGAAMVTGALALAISRGLKQRVKLILCCAENLVSGHAFKLGDILTYKNGISVEIQNTDAEGRLVLADGLMAASDSGAAYILDAATLTGAAKTALGRDYNAVFALDETEQQRALAAAKAEQEKAWALPLEPWHASQLTSAFAELGNVASAEGTAGATTAAAFLSRFVRDEGRGWVHLDLAASYQKSGNDLWATGAKGHGLRTIARWLQEVTQ
ncbi:aminopeptidase PepB [Aeromonas sp. MR19]|uniref:Aminopeptidase PepB n=1 Tax=Aeromonas bestiarum TaxID=105751 RepID=A0ABT7PTP4_9GAMM|nr:MULTISPECIES: aminopeptidase PepB [Aeromonas]EKP0277466.1 aminopeptidase PepB [Aeromonas bestiarum]MCH7374041.1 aminopeptidase PepB [Aeromonas sp. MR19]MDM5070458.1 aminopeptidase PepB [Aeromonas bestiarum]MDM5088282.1 aminopeptidase PepB [Aeromonas bestiarum]POG21425.1 aminopeptidase PepB [Aeromonas bestiarum]